MSLKPILTAALLGLAAWVLYARTVHYDYVYYDDVRILLQHPELYDHPSLSSGLRAIFTDHFPREEPLLVRDLSWWIDGRLFGFGNPVGYHLGNVLWHGMVVALMFVFLFGTTGAYGFSLFTTLAFLVLAVHVEPVAWIMGRKDMLSALFMLLALCFQTQRLRLLEARERRRAGIPACYLATLACVAAGLFSKISVLSFPAVLFLHAACFPFLRRDCRPDEPFEWRRLLLREIPLLVPPLWISFAAYAWYGKMLEQVGLFDRGYSASGGAHLWNLAMINPMAWALYLRQIFVPTHLSLCYAWPRLESSFSLPHIIAAWTILAGLAALGAWLVRFRKDLFFYYAAFFTLLVPYMNLVYIGIWMADRYIYFASFCVLALAVSMMREAATHARRNLRVLLYGLAVVVLILNAWRNLWYQSQWRDGESLWTYHIQLPNPSVIAYEALASFYFSMAEKAEDRAELAFWIRKMEVVVEGGLDSFWPNRESKPPSRTWKLFFLRSLVQRVRGLPDEEALESLLISDRLRPAFDATQLNLARLYRKMMEETQDPGLRVRYAGHALARFREYLRITFRGRPPTPEAQQELELLLKAVEPDV